MLRVLSPTVVPCNDAAVVLSQPQPADLVVYRGDTGRFRVTVTTADGVPLDVSGAVWDCDIRATHDSAAVLATLTVTPVTDDPSSVDVVLAAVDSAQLDSSGVWDLQMTLSGDVTTLLTGLVTVVLDVSR